MQLYIDFKFSRIIYHYFLQNSVAMIFKRPKFVSFSTGTAHFLLYSFFLSLKHTHLSFIIHKLLVERMSTYLLSDKFDCKTLELKIENPLRLKGFIKTTRKLYLRLFKNITYMDTVRKFI